MSTDGREVTDADSDGGQPQPETTTRTVLHPYFMALSKDAGLTQAQPVRQGCRHRAQKHAGGAVLVPTWAKTQNRSSGWMGASGKGSLVSAA